MLETPADNVGVAVFALGVGLMAPILWAALGELISEQSGVLNVGIEGVMLIAAFASAVTFTYSGTVALSVLAGLGSGLACGVVLSFLYIRHGTDQIVTGILFNIFALGLTTTLYAQYLTVGGKGALGRDRIPGLGDIPYVGEIFFNHNFLVYGAFLGAVAMFFIMRRTWFGLYIRAAGEHPRATETAGLNVWALRYAALIIGCVFVAAGGVTLVLATTGTFIAGMTAGKGFIALAVVVLARWNAIAAVGASLLFGVAQALQFEVEDLGMLNQVPGDFWVMFPYLVTVLAVMFARGSGARYPAACGVPYRPSRAAKWT